MNRIYLCIDLKTFYASVECALRGLDPFKTNLVVADPSRKNGALCLAITPAMKALGIHNRCRLFEIQKNVKYIIALPRMQKYIDTSAEVYSIYLRYVAKEDIHVYSIDEAFLDVTNYLKLYRMTAEELAKTIMNDIYNELHLTATAGIGTNLFLCKVALDITAKHIKSNIGYLDEQKFKDELWLHTPLTDFWQIGRGISRRLNNMGLYTMKDIALCDEKRIYKEFGINGEFIIDHSKGIEPCTMKEIKNYKRENNSISQGQVLFEDYTYDKARIAMKEMVDLLSLELIDKKLVGNVLVLNIGYSKDIIKSTGGAVKITQTTNVFSILLKYFDDLYFQTTSPDFPIRRITIAVDNVISEDKEFFDLFTDEEKVKKERSMERTINEIKKMYGKNSILKAMNLQEGATTRKRNKLLGGHNSGEEN